MNKCTVNIVRNGDKISNYNIIVYRKDKEAFSTTLSRQDAETVFGLYTYYGGNITARNVANEFPKYTLPEIKYIFRAFRLTKDNIWAPPHLVEEMTKEELAQYRMNLKERAAFKYADATQEKDFKTTLNKIAIENQDLKRKLEAFSNFKIKVPQDFKPHKLNNIQKTDRGLNIYLADIHLGASVTSGPLYKENINYGFKEAKRRLSKALESIYSYGNMDFINIILMGDNIDCCGFTGLTARRDHIMPENMDSREQANKFIDLMLWFISSLHDNNITSNISLYSVPCGNHTGDYEYIMNKALFSAVNVVFPDIKATLFDTFYGIFTVNSHTFLITHGKDAAYCKKGLPLNLNEKTKIMIYEYLDDNKIYSSNIHIVKGDLHSNNLDSCKRFDYRNVLSLFGASDYSNYNFSRNTWGISYDLMLGSNLIRGTFENL